MAVILQAWLEMRTHIIGHCKKKEKGEAEKQEKQEEADSGVGKWKKNWHNIVMNNSERELESFT